LNHQTRLLVEKKFCVFGGNYFSPAEEDETRQAQSDFNSTVPGRYVFQFHNGVPLGTP
jgi:hypothetical protein